MNVVEPLDETNVRERSWRKLLRRSGLRYRPLYHCRHTYATLELESRESPLFVSRQLGHAIGYARDLGPRGRLVARRATGGERDGRCKEQRGKEESHQAERNGEDDRQEQRDRNCGLHDTFSLVSDLDPVRCTPRATLV